MMVIFLHNPLLDIHSPEVVELLQSCTMKNISFASNLTTAEFIIFRFFEKEMAPYCQGTETGLCTNHIYA